jgi:hypothetical protein
MDAVEAAMKSATRQDQPAPRKLLLLTNVHDLAM